MKYNLIFSLLLLSACSDNDAEQMACETATKELADATAAVDAFRKFGKTLPQTCNPCTAQQTYSIELTKLVRLETTKKVAKQKACNY